ncbi:MAG: UvrD-helicase domain-containing protein, partial [Planctomycetota bacterium]
MKKYVLRPPSGGSYRVDYEKDLNPRQLEVVCAGDGPLLVIAGAGSGKTRTLTYRVSRLVESGVSTSSILLVTFTNKAAREMLRRVERLLQTDIRRITGGTFHHVGNLFLRKHGKLVDYPPNFTIL